MLVEIWPESIPIRTDHPNLDFSIQMNERIYDQNIVQKAFIIQLYYKYLQF